MKILQVVTAFSPAVTYGGPSTVAEQQAKTLVELGHRVTVATSDILELKPAKRIERSKSELKGVEVRYFSSRLLRPHFSFIVSREFSSWLRENIEYFDVAHIHFAREWFPMRAAQIATRHGVPTFIQPHGMLGRRDGVRKWIDRLWSRPVLEGATGVLSFHQQDENEVRRVASQIRTFRFPNGIDVPPDAGKWTTDNLSDPTVLFLARLHPRKRVLAFIEMARLLRDQGVKAHYRIVGPDGGDLEKARRLVRGYELENIISFIGSLEEQAVHQEYLDSAVYVLPSVNEPFPRTVLEALGMGVPIVVTDSCFIAPMLGEHGAALVSSPEPEDMANAVRRILSDAEFAMQLSRAGRTLIQEELTSEQVGKRLEGYYEEAHA